MLTVLFVTSKCDSGQRIVYMLGKGEKRIAMDKMPGKRLRQNGLLPIPLKNDTLGGAQ